MDLFQPRSEIYWRCNCCTPLGLSLLLVPFVPPLPCDVCVCRSVAGNKLSGSLPETLSSLNQLWFLDASSNYHTGTIPALPLGLNVLALHKNRLIGQLDHVQNIPGLCILTIFHNSLGGSLILPQMNACQFIKKDASGQLASYFRLRTRSPLLYGHSNRLSCSVQGNSSVFMQKNSSSLADTATLAATCADNASFRDCLGYDCAHWASDLPCQTIHLRYYNYNASCQASIEANCPVTCGICAQVDSSRLLVAPGNQLGRPQSLVSNMSGASFMWVQETIGKEHW